MKYKKSVAIALATVTSIAAVTAYAGRFDEVASIMTDLLASGRKNDATLKAQLRADAKGAALSEQDVLFVQKAAGDFVGSGKPFADVKEFDHFLAEVEHDTAPQALQDAMRFEDKTFRTYSFEGKPLLRVAGTPDVLSIFVHGNVMLNRSIAPLSDVERMIETATTATKAAMKDPEFFVARTYELQAASSSGYQIMARDVHSIRYFLFALRQGFSQYAR